MKSTKINYALEKDFGLQISDEKKQRKEKRPKKNEMEQGLRTGQMPVRMRLQQTITAALKGDPSLTKFAVLLMHAGVDLKIKTNKEGEPDGVSFALENVAFTGTHMGDDFKWKSLLKRGLQYDKNRESGTVEHFRLPPGTRGAFAEPELARSQPNDVGSPSRDSESQQRSAARRVRIG